MPTLKFTERYPLPAATLFAFFRRPANVVAVAPPEADIVMEEGPESLQLGDRFAVRVRRFGLSRRIVSVLEEMEEPRLLRECQEDGPFRLWIVERRFVTMDDGTELTETIMFESPGGLLGVMLTPAVVERELTQAYDGRRERVLAQLNASG